jgi:hypothetical protein
MATTDLRLNDPGSLQRPGPVGRFVRLALGSLCLWYVFRLIWQGTIETRLLALVIWVWELYIFSHLGLAFVVSELISSPGCEMRAFHFLYSRLSGNETKEHYCPIGPLHSIDQWEAGRNRD